MSAETNKALVREYIEQVWNKRRPDLLEQYMAKDVVHHDAPGVTDLASIQYFIALFQNAFPDSRVNLETEIADGDLLAVRLTVSGTQQGEFMGLPASGKQFSMAGMGVFRFANGKISEIWTVNDNLGMMQQIGAIPAPQLG